MCNGLMLVFLRISAVRRGGGPVKFGCRPLGYGSVDSCLAPACIGDIERVLRPTRSGRAWSVLLIRAALICARWRQLHGPLGQCCWTLVPIW